MHEDDVLEAPADDVAQEPEMAGPSYCRHCGQPNDAALESDWLCPECERYQDSMVCPTCHQVARISLMPDDLAPTPHAPARRRKAKE